MKVPVALVPKLNAPDGDEVAAVDPEKVAPANDPVRPTLFQGDAATPGLAIILVRLPLREPVPKLTLTVVSPFTLVKPLGITAIAVALPIPV